MKLRVLLGAAVALAGVTVVPSVAAAQPAPPAGFSSICSGATSGTAVSGDYHDLTITGDAYVPDGATLDVSGNLVIAPGSCLDAFSLGTVHVGHNVLVESAATAALGCAPGSNGPPPLPPCGFQTTDDTVGGNIVGSAPRTMYLTAVTVTGNVVSTGGGPGTQNPAISFAVKDDVIGHNLVLEGWQGAWIGALRNEIYGNVVIADNAGSRLGPSGQPDSTEVVGNTVGRNLICVHNTPPAQYGDALGTAPGNGPNVVGGRAIGECSDLTA